MISIVTQLVKARSFRRMTARQLAKRTGIANTTISAIEHGKVNLTAKSIEKLVEAMDMTILIIPKEYVQ